METTVNRLRHIRTFVQVNCLAPGRLDCVRRWLGYLSDVLERVLAPLVSLIPSLCGILKGIQKILSEPSFVMRVEVAERKPVDGCEKGHIHDRRHALFTGSANKETTIE